jgi:hypothetical protein
MLARRRLMASAAGLLLPSAARADAFGRYIAPGWVKPGAAFDLDFKNSRCWGGGFPMRWGNSNAPQFSVGDLITDVSTSNPAYYPDRTGKLLLFSGGGTRITDGMGLWGDNGSVISSFFSRDLTNAVWVKTNITALKNQIGADGVANAASQITATAVNATILQAITVASQAMFQSVYVKRLSGSGTVGITMDGTTFTTIAPTASWARYFVPSQTLATLIVGIQLGTSGDSVAVDFFNTGNGSIACVTATVGAAIQQFGREPTLGSTTGAKLNDGNMLIDTVFQYGGPMSAYAETEAIAPPPALGGAAFVSSSGLIMFGGSNGAPATFGGATTANSGVQGLGNINRVAGSINASGATGLVSTKLILNGGAIAVGGNNLFPPSTRSLHVGLGNNGASANALCGCIGRLTFWKRELAPHELINLTTGPIL